MLWIMQGPLHTQHCELVTITLQALSLVEKTEPVQVRFTLLLRDQRRKWCKMDEKSTCIPTWHRMDQVSWPLRLYCQNPPLGGRPNTEPEDHGISKSHNHWFILFYHVQGPAWIESHWNSIWLRARSHMASHYTWGFVTTLHDVGDVLGRPLDTFFGHSQFHGHGSWP